MLSYPYLSTKIFKTLLINLRLYLGASKTFDWRNVKFCSVKDICVASRIFQMDFFRFHGAIILNI
jgi:hypothetical protein